MWIVGRELVLLKAGRGRCGISGQVAIGVGRVGDRTLLGAWGRSGGGEEGKRGEGGGEEGRRGGGGEGGRRRGGGEEGRRGGGEEGRRGGGEEGRRGGGEEGKRGWKSQLIKYDDY